MEKYNRIKALISLDAVKYNFEQMKKQVALDGKAKEAFALTNEDSVRRAVGFCRLVQDWKNEYRRSQG